MQLKGAYKKLSVSVKAGVWFTICNIVQRGISFITMPIFTRIMSKSSYGMFSTYTSWYSFLLIFTSLNLSSFVFNKGMVKFDDDRDDFQASLLSLGSLTTFIVFILYYIFRENINEYTGLSTGIMLCMFIHLYFEPAILLWTAKQRFEYKYISVILVTLSIAILNPLFGIIAINIGKDELVDRILSNTIVPVLFGTAITILTIKKSKRFIITRYWKYALMFNLPLIPHFLSTNILNQADRIMITNLCGADDTALYSVAYSLGMLIMLFSTAIQQSLLPWLYTKLKHNSYSKIKDITNITIMIMFSLCLMLILIAPEVMNILAPTTYADAIWVIPPVCGSVFFVYIFNTYANIEYYFEETKYVALASIFAAVLNCVLNYCFIIKFGFVAAGYTTLFCYILLAVLHYVSMKIICKKHGFVQTITDNRFIFFSAIVFLVLLFLFVITYKIAIIRYILFTLIICIIWKSKNKIVSTIKQVRGEQK